MRSVDLELAETTTLIVWALSLALIPVVTPFFASIETVKAVHVYFDLFLS